MRGNRRGLLAIFVAAAIGGCPGNVEQDVTKSSKRLDIAKDFLSKGELVGAETETNRAIALNQGNDEAYNVRGLIAMVRAQATKQILEIDGCLTGVDAEATHADLDKHLQQADLDFAQAAKISPDYSEAWNNRGVVATLLENYDGAVEYLGRALQNPTRLIEPGLTRANLGWALFHQGKLVEAAKELRQVLQFQRQQCVATYRLGRVYFAREEWDKAAESFETVSNDPSCRSQESSLYLMKTRMQQGLAQDARAARDKCLERSPKSCIAAQCSADGAGLGASTGTAQRTP